MKSTNAAIAERRIKALELRKEGMTYRQIGKELGITHVDAFHDVKKSLDELAEMRLDRATELREMELSKLDRMEARLVDRFGTNENDGELKAIDRLLKIAERRSRLLGLDEPERVVHIENRPELMLDDELETELAEIMRKRRAGMLTDGIAGSNGSPH